MGVKSSRPKIVPGKHGQADEGADHEVVAVGEVDKLDDPVHER